MPSHAETICGDWTWDDASTVARINSGILYIDRMLQLTVYNALASQLLGITAETGRAVPLADVLSPEREEYALLVSIARSNKELRNHIVTWASEGGIRHVLVDSYCEEGTGPRAAGTYVILKDLGDLPLLEQQLQKTDKLATVGKIAAGIAHEIRNPLTTIKGFLQVMASRFAERDMSEEMHYVGVMLAEIDRVNSLVSELLLLAKPRTVEKRPCSVKTMLEELNPLIESQALLRGIEYVCDVENVPMVLGDVAMLKQVVLNLVKNALEAMDTGGVLRVAARISGSHVQIDVSDTGPGIPYYQIDKIFDAFYTTKEKGTGLGLPICQRIVAEHGGEIRVSSKGYGTTFSVLLPRGLPDTA